MSQSRGHESTRNGGTQLARENGRETDGGSGDDGGAPTSSARVRLARHSARQPDNAGRRRRRTAAAFATDAVVTKWPTEGRDEDRPPRDARVTRR